jgi:hypothetical protein
MFSQIDLKKSNQGSKGQVIPVHLFAGLDPLGRCQGGIVIEFGKMIADFSLGVVD